MSNYSLIDLTGTLDGTSYSISSLTNNQVAAQAQQPLQQPIPSNITFTLEPVGAPELTSLAFAIEFGLDTLHSAVPVTISSSTSEKVTPTLEPSKVAWYLIEISTR